MKPEELWKEYCMESGIDPKTHYDAWAFCGGGAFADELLKLVLEGKKFGTASIYEEYLAADEKIPDERSYSVVLNAKEEAVCVIRNFDVTVHPFLKVSEYHGYSEGEEERNLAAWRRIHDGYWQPDFTSLGIRSAEDCHVVEEKFTVEFTAPGYKHADDGGIFLTEACPRYAQQITEYRNEMLEAESSFDGCLSLKRMPDPIQFCNYARQWGNPMRELGEKGVRGTLLMCIRKNDDRLIGMIQLFNVDKEHPMYSHGNIGYSVRPEERRKGYAKLMLKKGLEYFKYGLCGNTAEVNCLPDNEASRRTILACGGVFKGINVLKDEGVELENYEFDLTDC